MQLHYTGKWCHFFYDCRKRRNDKNNNKRRKTYERKRNNFKRGYNKHRNYVNFMEKDKYDSSYADTFIKDYNFQDNRNIN